MKGGGGMKNIFAWGVLIFSFLLLTGMGGLGGSTPVDKIPEPPKKFTVVVVDRQGVKTTLGQFSHEGKVFITGKRGNADVASPFENISQVQFKGEDGNDIGVEIHMREPKAVEIRIDKRSKFYGKAEFGTFQIESKDLQSINFTP
jgi:hypothetical protein